MLHWLSLHPDVVAVVFAVWIGFHFVLRPTLLGIFREQLFEIRDGLFDAAAAGDLGFDEPAYRLLRQELNATIHSAHLMTLGHLVWFAACHRWGPKPGDGTLRDVGTRLDARIAEIDATPQAAMLRRARRKMEMSCVTALILTSVFVLFFIALIVFFWMVGHFASAVSTQCIDISAQIGRQWVDAAVEIRNAEPDVASLRTARS
ncbi:MAG TPA: hypothetical protein VN716_19000 [Vicinamibacterales bacterium]|nr:hypothetical protein [Vicinamibacterales bacterium]